MSGTSSIEIMKLSLLFIFPFHSSGCDSAYSTPIQTITTVLFQKSKQLCHMILRQHKSLTVACPVTDIQLRANILIPSQLEGMRWRTVLPNFTRTQDLIKLHRPSQATSSLSAQLLEANWLNLCQSAFMAKGRFSYRHIGTQTVMGKKLLNFGKSCFQ